MTTETHHSGLKVVHWALQQYAVSDGHTGEDFDNLILNKGNKRKKLRFLKENLMKNLLVFQYYKILGKKRTD